MKLTVHLVTWNGAKYVSYLFDSLRKQSFSDWKLYVWDNGSKDGMFDLMKAEGKDFPVEVEYISCPENKGFAGGHNALFRQTESEYFLLLNQDMYLHKDVLADMVNFLDEHKDAAAVSPRLMRWHFSALRSLGEGGDDINANELAQSFTDYIDALGLKVFRNRRVIDLYTQCQWTELKKELPEQSMEVFGLSGAFPMFRRSMLTQVCFEDGSFFDESYGSYKEDVDLAFRLRMAGFSSYILLDAVAYHDRSAAGPKEMSDMAAFKNKKVQSSWVKQHSYKNHLMTLYKNEYTSNFLKDYFHIMWYEKKKFIYFLLFDRIVLKGLAEVWKRRKALKAKRKYNLSRANISPSALRRWWS